MSKDNNETMKVFIRVRPQLKNEFLKNIAIASDSTVTPLTTFRLSVSK